MKFNKIISISGKAGLFRVLTQTKSAFIAESLIDKKRVSISSLTQISSLENIAIYTHEKEVPLLVVFKIMYEKTAGKQAISHKKSGLKLALYFSEILPNYDQERVYTSNIKKVIQWYNLLVRVGVDFSKIDPAEQNIEKV